MDSFSNKKVLFHPEILKNRNIKDIEVRIFVMELFIVIVSEFINLNLMNFIIFSLLNTQ